LPQLALIVVACPFAGAAGLADGAQTGTLPPPVQVSVWFGGVPLMTNSLQLGETYVSFPA
jgi:hypothetical protein